MKSTDITTSTYSIRQLVMMADKNNLLFDYPIQRPGGQWKRLQESYLIHSLAADYPIPPIYLLSAVIDRDIEKNTETVTEPVTVRYVLDGKQRITTAMLFKNGLFSLDKTTPTIFIDEEEFEISGKKFDALDDEVQEMILSRTLTIYTINSENVTDEEIEDLFYRMNNGTGLTIAQKSKSLMGTKWAKRIVKLGEHDLFKTNLAAFSPTQIKSEAHLIAIMQTMMMMDNYTYKNVSQKVISEYSQTFKNDTDHKLELLNKVDKALDYLVTVFNKKEAFLLKKVNFPMTLLTTIDAIEKGIEFDVFADWVVTFKEACKAKGSITHSPTTYMDYSGVGSIDRPKADGRLNEMKRHFNEYLELHNLVDDVLEMRPITIGEHYTYDEGDSQEILIMFVTAKEKYTDEDAYYYDTIALNPLGEVFEKDYELDFFQSNNVRPSTNDEIKKLRDCSPVDIKWTKAKIEKIIEKHWDILERPDVIFDPVELLERQYFGAYEPSLQAIIFRSEFLALVDIDKIERTLTHELCHWYLHVTGQNWRDIDVRFNEEIIRVGVEDTVNLHNTDVKNAFEKALIK